MYVGDVSMSGYSELKQNQSSVQDADLSIGTQKPKEKKEREKEKKTKKRVACRPINELMTYEEANAALCYDPETGIITRRVTVFTGRARNIPKVLAGDVATLKRSNGYLRVVINYKEYQAHRVAWLLHYGHWPENDLDHENRIVDDNRICNLREVSKQCNMRNCKVAKNNKTGVTGVRWDKRDKTFIVNVSVFEKNIYIASARDFTEAVAHRLAAEQALDWSGCDSNSSAYQYMQAYVRGEDMQSYLKDLASK